MRSVASSRSCSCWPSRPRRRRRPHGCHPFDVGTGGFGRVAVNPAGDAVAMWRSSDGSERDRAGGDPAGRRAVLGPASTVSAGGAERRAASRSRVTTRAMPSSSWHRGGVLQAAMRPAGRPASRRPVERLRSASAASSAWTWRWTATGNAVVVWLQGGADRSRPRRGPPAAPSPRRSTCQPWVSTSARRSVAIDATGEAVAVWRRAHHRDVGRDPARDASRRRRLLGAGGPLGAERDREDVRRWRWTARRRPSPSGGPATGSSTRSRPPRGSPGRASRRWSPLGACSGKHAQRPGGRRTGGLRGRGLGARDGRRSGRAVRDPGGDPDRRRQLLPVGGPLGSAPGGPSAIPQVVMDAAGDAVVVVAADRRRWAYPALEGSTRPAGQAFSPTARASRRPRATRSSTRAGDRRRRRRARRVDGDSVPGGTEAAHAGRRVRRDRLRSCLGRVVPDPGVGRGRRAGVLLGVAVRRVVEPCLRRGRSGTAATASGAAATHTYAGARQLMASAVTVRDAAGTAVGDSREITISAPPAGRVAPVISRLRDLAIRLLATSARAPTGSTARPRCASGCCGAHAAAGSWPRAASPAPRRPAATASRSRGAAGRCGPAATA